MEAIAHGAPPVLLDTRVAREVYGEGARYVALRPPAIAAALLTLLTDDVEHARVLSAARTRLAALSWSTTARVIQGALERAGTGRAR
jgi:glycosyltransferase involved in cell wall biosynthesis